jgi:hypothetical protein
MAEKLRIVVDNVTLEVNDNGDTIVLPLGDERFIKRVYDYAEKMQNGAEELSKKQSEDDIIGTITADIEYHDMLKTEFDSVFGTGAYNKVYGDNIVVGVEYIIQFIGQIMPYVQKHQANRSTKLSKYSANRTGSSL